MIVLLSNCLSLRRSDLVLNCVAILEQFPQKTHKKGRPTHEKRIKKLRCPADSAAFRQTIPRQDDYVPGQANI
jgi:hypothetical protein